MAIQAVAEQYPDFYNLARGGALFHAQTAVTGVAPGTAIGTTAAFALYNPVGSGVNLVVCQSWLQYVSGTLGVGIVSYVAHTNPAQAAFTGTAIVSTNAFVGQNAAGQGRAFTTVTVPAGGVAFRPHADLSPMLATSVLVPWAYRDDVNGTILIAPGAGISLQATAAAGTTPLVIFGIAWGEVSTAA